MASDPQGKFRSLEPPGMVTSMRKMGRSSVIFVIITTYGHTQYSTPRDVLGKTGQGRDKNHKKHRLGRGSDPVVGIMELNTVETESH